MRSAKIALMLVALALSGCGSAQKTVEKVEPAGGAKPVEEQALRPRGFSPLELGLLLVGAREAGASRCVSPVNLMMALEMAREGAVGATREELDAFLGHPLVGANRALVRMRAAEGPLRVANAIWSDEGLQPSEVFVEALAQRHDALATVLPLRDQPERAAADINSWVEERTEGLIARLVEAGDVAQASMVLTNALYFKGRWAHPFDKDRTKAARFHAFRGAYDVEMMHQKRAFCYAEDAQLQALELPYREEGYSMMVVLPRASAEATRWEAIDAGRVKALFDALEYEQVDVSLPRFDSELTLRLVPSLRRLGLKTSLSAAADFSGMGVGYDAAQIGEVIQAVRFTVDEEQTEAAAATAVVMVRGALPLEAIQFTADRPFLYIVYRETVENAVFVGVLDD